MKRIVLFMAAMVTLCFTGHAQKNRNVESGKTLVAYYSATGTTENAARMIASATGGTLYKIQPEKDYTSADLDWNDKSSRSSKEMADTKARPALLKHLKDADSYDVIYIGFPIWWNEAPRIINTFLESYDFSGKSVIPFATSGGSGINNSEKILKQTYPKLNWQQGRLLNRATKEEITRWVKASK